MNDPCPICGFELIVFNEWNPYQRKAQARCDVCRTTWNVTPEWLR